MVAETKTTNFRLAVVASANKKHFGCVTCSNSRI